MAVTEFPIRPFDGMKFVDAWRRQWIFDTDKNCWRFDGLVPDIPIADETTIGLLSPQLKQKIDALPEKAGGFGILTKFSFGKIASGLFNGVLSGDINIKSNSLEIKCKDADGKIITKECKTVPFSPELPDRVPAIDINFSEDFLDTFCVEVPGKAGPKGPRGPKGPKGKDGTGDGPKGEKGPPGEDATGVSEVESVIVEFDDAFYDRAVVALDLDTDRSILSVTKGPLAVPSDDDPADQVVTMPIFREIEWIGDLFDYSIIKNDNDETNTRPDVNLLAYGADFNKELAGDDEDTEVIKKNLSDYINQVLEIYKARVEQFTQEYDDEIKAFIIEKDDQARKALDGLVSELATLAFDEGFEYCMGLEDNGICGQQMVNEFKKFREDTMNVRLIQKLDELVQATESGGMAVGGAPIMDQMRDMIAQSAGVSTLSRNSSLISAFQTSASEFDQFNASICAYAQSILQANNIGVTEASDFCADANSTKVTSITLEPGEEANVTVGVGGALPAGAYIIQYTGGALFDGGQPDCGYFVGTNESDRGIAMIVDDSTTETTIFWPESSNLAEGDEFDPEKVEEAYLSGPIVEFAVGTVVAQGASIVLRALVSDEERSSGAINFNVFHCSRCN